MKECERYRALVIDEVEGRLTGDGRQTLMAHVATCGQCARLLADHVRIKDALVTLPLPSVSAGFAARVREHIAPARSWFDVANWQSWTLRLAPLALVLCLMAWWPSQRDEASTSLSAQLQSFSTAGATEAQRLVVDADADTERLMSAALGEVAQ